MWHKKLLVLMFLLLLVPLAQANQFEATTPTSDFTINSDGTVTHKTTGLTWKRCVEGMTWTGSSCSGSAETYTWSNANALGKGGWRLPTIAELETIVERDGHKPTINTTIFPNTPLSSFWSASTSPGDSDYAKAMDFIYGTDGGAGYDFGANNYSVRLVHSGKSGVTSPTPTTTTTTTSPRTTEYTSNDDGTVTHNKTGLIWRRCSEGQSWTGGRCSGTAQPYTWAEANALTARGWRLPTIAELVTIVERENYSPAINTAAFPNTPAECNILDGYWSSSIHADTRGDPSAWYVDFCAGRNYGYSTSGNFLVRLVSGGQPPSSSGLYTPSADFTFTGDGVTHNKTGLMWKRCLEGQRWTGTTCSGTAGDYTWAEAKGLSTSTWRLPTANELLTVVEWSAYDPSINTEIFPDAPTSSYYWSVSAYANSSDEAWKIYSNSGNADNDYKGFKQNVRLVQGTQVAPQNNEDRVLNWAESLYPDFFPKGPSTTVSNGQSSRSYATGNVITIRNGRAIVHNGRDWNWLDVGAFSDYLTMAISAGF